MSLPRFHFEGSLSAVAKKWLFELQILYAGEGESRKPDEGVSPNFDDSVGSNASLASSAAGARAAPILYIKGHEFVQVMKHLVQALNRFRKDSLISDS